MQDARCRMLDSGCWMLDAGLVTAQLTCPGVVRRTQPEGEAGPVTAQLRSSEAGSPPRSLVGRCAPSLGMTGKEPGCAPARRARARFGGVEERSRSETRPIATVAVGRRPAAGGHRARDLALGQRASRVGIAKRFWHRLQAGIAADRRCNTNRMNSRKRDEPCNFES
jgi:hypothetical protein